MGVPATLADLDSIAANNSPSGSDPIGTNLDDYLRSHASLIKQTSTSALGIIPSGTRMPFAQANAPTGWTQAVTDSEDNRMLRVVKTAGTATIGGSHSPILNNVVPAHTHTITTGGQSVNHTHAVSDPGHLHGFYQAGDQSNATATEYPDNGINSPINTNYTHTATTGISIGSNSVDHTHSGTTNAGSSQTNWTPRYIDMIICSKD